MNRPRHLLLLIGVVYVATWVFVAWLTGPALDSYGDMVENYAWSKPWALGTFRHPPLFAWMTGAWFLVFPTRVLPYYLLSYLNAWVGILGILCLARVALGGAGVSPAGPLGGAGVSPAHRRDVFEILVVLFAMLGFPYGNLAAKFNADTVLLSLWPWTAYAFFASLHAGGTRRRWMFTILLALVAAASMLAKYYSGVLLVALLAISLSDRAYRRWFLTPQPYVALALFVLLLLPHAAWEVRVGFPLGGYLEGKIDEAVSPGRIVLFLGSGIYYLAVSWIAWLIVRRRFAREEARPIAWTVPPRALVMLCLLPAVLTTAFNVFARVHLTTHWAIPVWFGLPVLMAAWLLPRIGDGFAWRRFLRGLATFWVVLLLGVVAYTVVLSAKGNPKYTLGRQEMVRSIEDRFAARFPGQQLSWVGGSWPEAGALAFFGTNHPRALPGVPDEGRALVTPYVEWRERYGVILCYPSHSHARAGTHNTQCEQDARGWLRARGLALLEDTVTYRAEGWRYLRPQPRNATVFWVPPAK